MNREPLRIEHAPERLPATRLDCDLCIVGAGAAGVSAAVEASRLGLRVGAITGVGQEDNGRYLKWQLSCEGVDVSAVRIGWEPPDYLELPAPGA